MQKLTATQAQLVADFQDCMLVRQAYVKQGLQQVHPRTDHCLLNAAMGAQALALTAGVDQATLDQAMNAADADAMAMTWGL